MNKRYMHNYDWLIDALDQCFPFRVDLLPDAKGWAKFATSVCNKRWRIRSKDVLVFEAEDDANRILLQFGKLTSYYEVKAGKKIIKLVDEYKKAGKSPKRGAIQKRLTKIKSEWPQRVRPMIAFQMWMADYKVPEIADELEYASFSMVNQAIDYIHKLKLSDIEDYAKTYRDENLITLAQVKRQLLNNLNEEGYKKTNTIETLLRLVAEESRLSGAYEAQKIEINNIANIEDMSTYQLKLLIQKIAQDNNQDIIIDHTEESKDEPTET